VEGTTFPQENGAKMKKAVVIILLVFALLFSLAGIGAALFFTFGPFSGRNVLLSRNLIYATAEETKTLNTDGPLTLKVQDDAGDVTIVSGRVDNVIVKAVKTGSGRTQADAEKDLKNIQYQIKQDGNTITITYKREDLNIDNNADTVDFTMTVPLEATTSVDAGSNIITIPSKATIDVNTGFGDVSVSDINGDVNIVNNFGQVTVLNIEGGLAADSKSGQVDATSINAGEENIELSSGFGTVSLERASGKDITLNSNSGVLKMNDVRASGNMKMSTDFGDISWSTGLAKLLDVETKSGKVTLDKITLDAALTVKSDFGEVSLEQVQATSYDLQTNSGSITVDGASGKVKAHSGFGSVTVKNADSVTLDLNTQSGPVDFEGSLGNGPHTIHSDFGEISLSIPADSALNVDLQTDFGTIKSEIPITVVLSGDIQKSHQTGTMNGGGDQLTVGTKNGSISIQASR
jgi:DUF4097 and DUF4098 domain-containing protein YvlB